MGHVWGMVGVAVRPWLGRDEVVNGVVVGSPRGHGGTTGGKGWAMLEFTSQLFDT